MSRIVTFGEIMGRLTTPGFQRLRQALPGSLEVTFAGAEASIAASIAYLGGDSAFVSALPEHSVADACVADLRSLGVDTSKIVRTSQGRLGLFFVERGINQRPGNVIYDREFSSVSITPEEAYDWNAIFEGADWFVITGITPAISRNTADVTKAALQKASERGVKVACDMNYRSKLWNWDPSLSPRELASRTMKELLPFVDLLVGGRDDAVHTLGIADEPDLEDLAREIARAYPRLRHVAMTVREGISATHNNVGGFLYEVESDSVFRAPEADRLYEIPHIVDRLGAGDAFTAGLLFALTTAELSEPQTAIAFAAAAGCLAHSIEGDYHYSTRSEIEALMRGESSGRVRR